MIEKRFKTKYRDLKVTFTVAEDVSEEEGWQNLKRAYDILFKHVEEENKNPTSEVILKKPDMPT